MGKRLAYYLNRTRQIINREYRAALFRVLGKTRETATIRGRQGCLTLSTRDELGAILFRDREYELESSIRAVRFLKQKDFIPETNASMLDVGANIGQICIGLLRHNQVDTAVAIEPEPRNFELLRGNVARNGLAGRIACVQVAVGDKATLVDMELSPTNRGDHRIRNPSAPRIDAKMGESARNTIQVRSLPLSDILALPEVQPFKLDRPSFVWIDVQGFEGLVFRGNRDLLAPGVPTVSEIWPYGILRSGMTLDEFVQIAGSIWTDYWIERRERYTRYPMAVFDRYLEEIGTGHADHENVIFTKRVS